MFDIIIIFTIIVGLIPLSLLLLRKVKQQYSQQISFTKPFLWLLFIGSVYELVFSVILFISTGPWFRLYYLLEFLVLYYFFKKFFGSSYRFLLNFFLVSYCLLWVILTLLWYKVDHSKGDTFLGVGEAVFVYIFAMLWIRQLFKNPQDESLFETPLFYFMAGFIVYFIGGFFVELLTHDIYENTGFITKYWMISVLLNLIMRILAAVGICKATEKN